MTRFIDSPTIADAENSLRGYGSHGYRQTRLQTPVDRVDVEGACRGGSGRDFLTRPLQRRGGARRHLDGLESIEMPPTDEPILAASPPRR